MSQLNKNITKAIATVANQEILRDYEGSVQMQGYCETSNQALLKLVYKLLLSDTSWSQGATELESRYTQQSKLISQMVHSSVE